MSLYAISDLHLAFNVDKPMDIFGPKWENHVNKLEENWRRKITEEDTVLIGGDISWGMNMDETIEELNWIHKLPGKKIIIKGNHAYWWNSITKLNSMYDNLFKIIVFLMKIMVSVVQEDGLLQRKRMLQNMIRKYIIENY